MEHDRCRRCLWLQLVLGIWAVAATASNCATYRQDVEALMSLRSAWWHYPPSSLWNIIDTDPFDHHWPGILCDVVDPATATTRVTAILRSNQDLDGSISPAIGNLTELTDLLSQHCNLSGSIPVEIGNMKSLRYLLLFQNQLEGPLPETIGLLRNLTWFDVSENRLSGPLPISGSSSIGSGLDNLTNALHLLLNNNKFSGVIPPTITELPFVQIIRLDSNELNGTIPFTVNAIKTLETLQLNMNNLSGPLPDLSNITGLQMLEVGNHPFDAAVIPTWIFDLHTLYLLSMDSNNLIGTIPPEIFAFSPFLSNVSLGSNRLTGTLDLTLGNVSTSLKLVNVTGNIITNVLLGNYSQELLLDGNPYCTGTTLTNCSLAPTSNTTAISSPTSACTNPCPVLYQINPKAMSRYGCRCSRPVTATCTFFATKVPLLTVYGVSVLEQWFAEALMRSAYLQLRNIEVNGMQAVVNILSRDQLTLSVFPSEILTTADGTTSPRDEWNSSEAALISYVLQNQDIQFPLIGPWGCMMPEQTQVNEASSPAANRNILSIGVYVGITMGVLFGVVLGAYARVQCIRISEAERVSRPFEPWIRRTGRNAVDAQLKGARVFSLQDCPNTPTISAPTTRSAKGDTERSG